MWQVFSSHHKKIAAAVRGGDNDTVVRFFQDNPTQLQATEFGGGRTIFHLLAKRNAVELANKLLSVTQLSAEALVKVLSITCSAGQTALLLACSRGNSEVLKWLLEHGADPHECDGRQGNSALHWAVEARSSACVALILAAGQAREAATGQTVSSLVNCYTRMGFTPLHLAAHKEELSSLRLLLAHGADLLAGASEATQFATSVQARPGFTALHIAAQRGLSSVARVLLSFWHHHMGDSKDPRTARDNPRGTVLQKGGQELRLPATPAQVARLYGHNRLMAVLTPGGPLQLMYEDRLALHPAAAAAAAAAAPSAHPLPAPPPTLISAATGAVSASRDATTPHTMHVGQRKRATWPDQTAEHSPTGLDAPLSSRRVPQQGPAEQQGWADSWQGATAWGSGPGARPSSKDHPYHLEPAGTTPAAATVKLSPLALSPLAPWTSAKRHFEDVIRVLKSGSSSPPPSLNLGNTQLQPPTPPRFAVPSAKVVPINSAPCPGAPTTPTTPTAPTAPAAPHLHAEPLTPALTVEFSRCHSLHSPAPAAAAAVEQGRLPCPTKRSKHSALGASEARPVLARPAKRSSTGLPCHSQSAQEKGWLHSSSPGSCPQPNGPTSPTNPGPLAAALAQPSPQSNRSGPLAPSPSPLGPGSLGPSAGEVRIGGGSRPWVGQISLLLPQAPSPHQPLHHLQQAASAEPVPPPAPWLPEARDQQGQQHPPPLPPPTPSPRRFLPGQWRRGSLDVPSTQAAAATTHSLLPWASSSSAGEQAPQPSPALNPGKCNAPG